LSFPIKFGGQICNLNIFLKTKILAWSPWNIIWWLTRIRLRVISEILIFLMVLFQSLRSEIIAVPLNPISNGGHCWPWTNSALNDRDRRSIWKVFHDRSNNPEEIAWRLDPNGPMTWTETESDNIIVKIGSDIKNV
jgi:hypothetical protein